MGLGGEGSCGIRVSVSGATMLKLRYCSRSERARPFVLTLIDFHDPCLQLRSPAMKKYEPRSRRDWMSDLSRLFDGEI